MNACVSVGASVWLCLCVSVPLFAGLSSCWACLHVAPKADPWRRKPGGTLKFGPYSVQRLPLGFPSVRPGVSGIFQTKPKRSETSTPRSRLVLRATHTLSKCVAVPGRQNQTAYRRKGLGPGRKL